jgi:transcriptional regulator with XRE-family HTH domain
VRGCELNRLKELRKERGVSPQVVADLLGISRQMYHSLEREEYRLNEDYLRALADYYGCSADYILGRTPVKTMTVQDIQTVDDLKRYLGLDDADVVKLLFIDPEQDDQTIPPDAVEHVLQAIEFVRWKYGLHGSKDTTKEG